MSKLACAIVLAVAIMLGVAGVVAARRFVADVGTARAQQDAAKVAAARADLAADWQGFIAQCRVEDEADAEEAKRATAPTASQPPVPGRIPAVRVRMAELFRERYAALKVAEPPELAAMIKPPTSSTQPPR